MRIPLLKITIYSVAGKYRDLVNIETCTENPLIYELDCVEGKECGLHDYFLNDYFDFDAFKSLFRRILRNIALFRHPILFKLISQSRNSLDWDDQMASETIYTDYMRVKSQYMEGSDVVYQGLKEAVHEIVITNAHLIQTAETHINRYGNRWYVVSDRYISHKDPITDASDVSIKHPNVSIPNDDVSDECNTL